MSWLAQVERRATLNSPTTSLTNPSAWFQEAMGALPSTAGVRVSEHSAMRFEIWWACVRAIADTIAVLPLVLKEKLPGGGSRHATELPQFHLVKNEPNVDTTSQYWRQTMQAWTCNWGNSYSEIEFNGAGDPIGLHPLLPDRTHAARILVKDEKTKEVAPKRVVICQVPPGTGFQGGSEVVLPAEKVLHIPGLGYDGVRGYPVVRMARQALGHAIAIDEFGARFFGSGARPASVITVPGTLSKEAKDRVRSSIEIQHQGLAQAHRVMVLDEGMQWHAMSVPPNDAQFVESAVASVPRICRWHRVPPHIVHDLSKGTFSNIEVQSIEFIRFTILQWVVAWEQWLNKRLLSPSQRGRYYFEFLIEGLLRGALKERYDAYAIGRQWGWLSADDIREIENMNPLPGGVGKLYLVPMNMVPAQSALAGVTVPPGADDGGGGESPAAGDDDPSATPSGNGGAKALPAWTSPVAAEPGAQQALVERERLLLFPAAARATVAVQGASSRFDPSQPREPDGKFGEGGETSKAELAKATYKPSTAEKQRWAEGNEQRTVGMVGGSQSGDNAPMDVTTKIGGELHGVEVKTMLDNGNDKITMHPESRQRKEDWASTNGATLHTVVYDDRAKFGSSNHSGHDIYYARGVGSFRLGGMTKVTSAAHLQRLIRA